MEPWKYGMLAAVLGLGCAGGVRADFAPMQVGNEWVYKGIGMVQPTVGSAWPGTDMINYREVLQLKIMGRTVKGDSILYTVEEKDSLYARTSAAFPGVPARNLPDTVSVRTLVYGEKGRRLRLAKGDSLHFGHADTSDLFFNGHDRVSGGGAALFGLTPAYAGVVAVLKPADYTRIYQEGQAWYLEGVGLYWAALRVSCGQCGCAGKRELMLQTFRGRSINPGMDPPGSALAKEGRFSCPLGKAPSRPGFSHWSEWGGSRADALGRKQAPGRHP